MEDPHSQSTIPPPIPIPAHADTPAIPSNPHSDTRPHSHQHPLTPPIYPLLPITRYPLPPILAPVVAPPIPAPVGSRSRQYPLPSAPALANTRSLRLLLSPIPAPVGSRSRRFPPPPPLPLHTLGHSLRSHPRRYRPPRYPLAPLPARTSSQTTFVLSTVTLTFTLQTTISSVVTSRPSLRTCRHSHRPVPYTA